MSDKVEKYDKDKSKFMEEFSGVRPDLFFPESWNDAQKKTASEIVRPSRVKSGLLSAIPMVCQAEKCKYAKICPLMEKNLAPEGKPCPIELSMIQVLFEGYVEELDVDLDKMVEVSMVRDLVDQEIQQNRATWVLSLEHFIQDNVVGVSSDGEPVVRKELHQAVEMHDKIHRRKDKIRAGLLATREARAKAGQGQLDSAQVISNMLQEQRKVENERQKGLLSKIGIKDYLDDDFIDEAVLVEGDEEETPE